MPSDFHEPTDAYLIQQAERFRTLKLLIDEGMADIAAGNVSEWNFEEFLREARLSKSDEK